MEAAESLDALPQPRAGEASGTECWFETDLSAGAAAQGRLQGGEVQTELGALGVVHCPAEHQQRGLLLWMGRVAENYQRSLLSHAFSWSEQVTVKPHKQDLCVSCSVLSDSLRSHGL